ncbi:hypothetical protein SAMN04487761_14018 [Lachnospiraceae bacterium C7]|nr:hypothetical protein SAMN04487761_14018 [Lachnospiraceae bacterium C7]
MYEKRNPKARLLLLTSSILNMIVITVILGAIIIFAQLDEMYDKAIIGVDIFAWIIALIAPFVRYNWYRARFTDEEIDIRQGFLIIQETIIPIERLQKISLETGPLDRIFGMTKVIVYTSGGEETIRFLEKERAEQIGETLKKRINKYGQKNKTDKAEV